MAVHACGVWAPCVRTHVREQVCAHMCVPTRPRAHTHMCAQHTCANARTHKHACARTRVRARTHTHMRTHTHTHIRTSAMCAPARSCAHNTRRAGPHTATSHTTPAHAPVDTSDASHPVQYHTTCPHGSPQQWCVPDGGVVFGGELARHSTALACNTTGRRAAHDRHGGTHVPANAAALRTARTDRTVAAASPGAAPTAAVIVP